MEKDSAQLTVQLSSLKTLKDGGYRITLDFGQESLEALHKLISWNNSGDINLACVLVPYKDSNKIETNEIDAG